jgi:hypothetical protein
MTAPPKHIALVPTLGHWISRLGSLKRARRGSTLTYLNINALKRAHVLAKILAGVFPTALKVRRMIQLTTSI